MSLSDSSQEKKEEKQVILHIEDESQPDMERAEDVSASPINENSEEADDALDPDEEVSKSTKVKVIAALMVVGLAVGTAYWVQSPDIRADVLNTQENTSLEENANNNETSPAVMKEENVAQAQITEDISDSSYSLQVSLMDFAFSPTEISVAKGSTVVWTNKDTVSHTISGSNFSSGTLNPGESFSYRFDQEGTFEYNCTFHPQMKGKVVVSASLGSVTDDSSQTVSSENLSTTPTSNSTTEVNSTVDPIQPVSTSNNSVSTPEPVSKQLYPAAEAAETDTVNSNMQIAQNNVVDLDPQALLQENLAGTSQDQQKVSPQKLATTGPEDYIYAFLFAIILYYNRRKVFAFLSK